MRSWKWGEKGREQRDGARQAMKIGRNEEKDEKEKREELPRK